MSLNVPPPEGDRGRGRTPLSRLLLRPGLAPLRSVGEVGRAAAEGRPRISRRGRAAAEGAGGRSGRSDQVLEPRWGIAEVVKGLGYRLDFARRVRWSHG